MSQGTGRRSTIRVAGALLGAVALLVLPAFASAQPLSYSFDSGAQGWSVSQTNGTGLTPATMVPTGGNPGGHLHAVDSGADSGCPSPGTPCNILYFESPTIFGGLAANYGGTASFDLGSGDEPKFASELVIGASSLQALLSGRVPETAGTGYHRLSIGLVEGPAWSFCTTSCLPASQAQFLAVMAAADFFSVNADVAARSTGESYDLDNVSLTDAPSPPAKRKKCKKKKKHHRAAAAKRKKCKKKAKKRISLHSAVR